MYLQWIVIENIFFFKFIANCIHLGVCDKWSTPCSLLKTPETRQSAVKLFVFLPICLFLPYWALKHTKWKHTSSWVKSLSHRKTACCLIHAYRFCCQSSFHFPSYHTLMYTPTNHSNETKPWAMICTLFTLPCFLLSYLFFAKVNNTRSCRLFFLHSFDLTL